MIARSATLATTQRNPPEIFGAASRLNPRRGYTQKSDRAAMNAHELAEALANKTTLVVGTDAGLVECAASEMVRREIVNQVTAVDVSTDDSPEMQLTPGWMCDLISDARAGARTLLVARPHARGHWMSKSLSALLHSRRFYHATVIIIVADAAACTPPPQYSRLFDIIASGWVEGPPTPRTVGNALLRRLDGAETRWQSRMGEVAIYDITNRTFLGPWRSPAN